MTILMMRTRSEVRVDYLKFCERNGTRVEARCEAPRR